MGGFNKEVKTRSNKEVKLGGNKEVKLEELSPLAESGF
jgi:hypothetical protein